MGERHGACCLDPHPRGSTLRLFAYQPTVHSAPGQAWSTEGWAQGPSLAAIGPFTTGHTPWAHQDQNLLTGTYCAPSQAGPGELRQGHGESSQLGAHQLFCPSHPIISRGFDGSPTHLFVASRCFTPSSPLLHPSPLQGSPITFATNIPV